MKMFVSIVREIAKVILITLYWGIPVYLWQMSEVSGYLWLFILSFMLTCVTLVHYENIQSFPEIPIRKDTDVQKVSVKDLYPDNEDDEL